MGSAEHTNHRRILMIRPGAIGDCLLTFPIMQVFKATDNAHITFVSNAAVLPLALACGLADEVDDYGALHWSELFSTEGIQSPSLRALIDSSDLVFCWLRDPEGLVQRNLRATHARRVMVAPGRPAEGTRIHIVDYLAQTAGIERTPLDAIVRGMPTLTTRAHVASEPTARQITIHPGSGGARKCWPVASFAAVIQQLWQRAVSVLLLAGPADHERLAALQHLLPTPPTGMLTTMVDAPLVEVAAALHICKGYLGNDSGITHLAALLAVPTIVLFGPTDPAVWKPVGPLVHVLHNPILEHLPVTRVMQAITELC
jgi:heptosyltransferase-3